MESKTPTVLSIRYEAQDPETGEKQNLLDISIGSGEDAQKTSVKASKDVPSSVISKVFKMAEGFITRLEKDMSGAAKSVSPSKEEKLILTASKPSNGRKHPGRKGFPVEYKQSMIRFVEERMKESKSWVAIVADWNHAHVANSYTNFHSMQAAFYKAKKDLGAKIDSQNHITTA
jgi:hypothetical protein